MTKKKVVIIIGIFLIIGSVSLNLYWFGWKRIEQRIYQRGVNDAIVFVVSQVQNTGEVRITTEQGTLILAPLGRGGAIEEIEDE